MADLLRFQNLRGAVEAKGNKVVVIARNNKLRIEKVIDESIGESINSIKFHQLKYINLADMLFRSMVKDRLPDEGI